MSNITWTKQYVLYFRNLQSSKRISTGTIAKGENVCEFVDTETENIGVSSAYEVRICIFLPAKLTALNSSDRLQNCTSNVCSRWPYTWQNNIYI